MRTDSHGLKIPVNPCLSVVFIFFILIPGLAQAAPSFVFPASCDSGADCRVVNYVDTDPAGNSARDYRCGPRTYDVHQGTDIALPDRVAMEGGVKILAAADGTVARIRDGMEDGQPAEDEIREMLAAQKGCGNAVLLDHGEGWQSIYCHMKKDSVAVKPGQAVIAGEKLGLIGQSGAAEMPHVHFGVFRDGKVVDPFTGAGEDEGCGRPENALWAENEAPPYEPLIIYAAGFNSAAPDFEAVKIDARGAKTIAQDSPVIAFWGAMYGVREGDRIRLEIQDPVARIHAKNDIVQEKTRARQFYYVGRRTDGVPLTPGEWTGYIRIVRENPDGTTLVREHRAPVTVK